MWPGPLWARTHHALPLLYAECAISYGRNHCSIIGIQYHSKRRNYIEHYATDPTPLPKTKSTFVRLSQTWTSSVVRLKYTTRWNGIYEKSEKNRIQENLHWQRIRLPLLASMLSMEPPWFPWIDLRTQWHSRAWWLGPLCPRSIDCRHRYWFEAFRREYG